MESLKVFELFSGIGGMHFALKEAELEAKIIRAIDINPLANEVYKINFPDTVLLEKNVQGLNDAYFNKLDIEMIMMSPPCQPFTRNGLRKDKEDNRSNPLLHFIKLIPDLKTVKYILLENVKGFENSIVRRELVNSLTYSGFIYQEFLLSPDQFSIPNSRLRYYLLAKKTTLDFCFPLEDKVMLELPRLCETIAAKIDKMNWKYKKLAKNHSCFEVESIVDNSNENFLSDSVLLKYGPLLDIVSNKSTRTCCFTKSYGRYFEGTGSVFSGVPQETIENVFKQLNDCEMGSQEYVELLKMLKLRFFSPEEISHLMTFPHYFKFPDHLTNKQKYSLLGNSICIHVVAILIILLVS